MRLDIAEASEILRRTPEALRALLDGLPEPWLGSNEGPGTWCAAEVLAHLADLERQDWIPRLRIILDEGPAHPFDPVDPRAFKETLESRNVSELLAIFAERRASSLRALEAMRLAGADLERPGAHPELGAVDLGQLLATWAVHDLNHLAQIARVMAKRYDSAVGPWKEYLSILHWKT